MRPALSVLVIDDDELSREVIEVYLTAAGHLALPAENGDAAFALVGSLSTPPDLLLSDLHMPGPTGPALLDLLRPRLASETPFIAMSASQPTPELIRGYTSFLLKPFTPEQLREAIAIAQQLAADPLRSPSAPSPVPAPVPPGAAGVPGAETLPVLDMTVFDQFAGMLRVEQMRELFYLCFGELDKHLLRMREAVAGADRDAMRHSAHTIKGSFAVVGARELQHLGALLEAGKGSAADLQASLDEIPLAAKRLRDMLGTRGIHLEH